MSKKNDANLTACVHTHVYILNYVVFPLAVFRINKYRYSTSEWLRQNGLYDAARKRAINALSFRGNNAAPLLVRHANTWKLWAKYNYQGRLDYSEVAGRRWRDREETQRESIYIYVMPSCSPSATMTNSLE